LICYEKGNVSSFIGYFFFVFTSAATYDWFRKMTPVYQMLYIFTQYFVFKGGGRGVGSKNVASLPM